MMDHKGKRLDFFLAANSPVGFASYFGALDGGDPAFTTYILGGCPGCGKSTLLRRVGEALLDRGETVEFIHCASDPGSYDAVLCPGLHLGVVDGTPPHGRVPRYPALAEQFVDLYRFTDPAAIAPHREEITARLDESARLQRRSGRFLSAAASLLRDNSAVVTPCLDLPKLERYALSTAKRLLPPLDKKGRTFDRFLSHLTPSGPQPLCETAAGFGRVILLEDSYQTAAPLFLERMAKIALAAGYDVYACYSPLSPYDKLEHLVLPEADLCLVSEPRQNAYAQALPTPFRHVYSRRFTDLDALYPYRNRLSFNKKAAKELVREAARLCAEAQEAHRQAEALYALGTDRAGVDALAGLLVEKLTAR